MKERKGKKTLTLIAGTAVTVFSLFSCVIAAIAWFSFASQAKADGETFRVVANGNGYDVGTINLYKFNYSESTVGSGENQIVMVDYLTPYTGNVGKYLYDRTRHQFGETVQSVWTPVTTMNIFDPIDLIIQRHDLIDLNCNAIYEVTLNSSAFTNCYFGLDALRLIDKTKLANEIFLTECVDFDVYTEADLADGAQGNFPNGDEYYPSYYARMGRSLTAEEEIYYKVSYLASLSKQELATNDHAHFYGQQVTPETVEVTKNRPITFQGQSDIKSLKVYINVNYAVSELNKYATSIYSSNIHAIFDYAFEFKISQGVIS